MKWKGIEDKKLQPMTPILINCFINAKEGGYYRLGWFTGAKFTNETGEDIPATEWCELPDPPLQGTEQLKKVK